MVSLLGGVQFLKEFGIFTVVMPFIFIFAVSYGILGYVKPFGDDKILNGVIAFVVAFFALQFMPLLTFIQLIVPYMFAFFVVVMLIVMLFKFIGVEGSVMQETYKHPGVYATIFLIILIGVFVFVSESFPELKVSEQEQPSGSEYTGTYTGEEEQQQERQPEVTQSDEGTVTQLPESEVQENQNFLRNTIFHPTILSIILMFVTFGAAAYMIVVIREE